MNDPSSPHAGFPVARPARAAFVRLILLLLLVVALAAGALRLKKDTSIEALVPDDDPALRDVQDARRVFGLSDPLALALTAPGARELLGAESQHLLAQLVDALAAVPGIDPEGIRSLLSENWVELQDEELRVQPLLRRDLAPERAAQELDRALIAMPEASGRVIAGDRSAALILCELREGADAARVYAAVRKLVAELQLPTGFELHIAGEAAVSGYLSTYIDRDALIVTPLCGFIMLVLLIAFMRRRIALVLGSFVLLGTLAATIGAMGWMGAPIYIITASLPAVLLSISIADTVHLLSRYQRLRAVEPTATARDCMVRAVREQWAPMALTSVTNACGFIGLVMGADLPPLHDYGLYAALGVGVASVLTLIGLPVLVEWIDSSRTVSPRLLQPRSGASQARWVGALADVVSKRPGRVLALVTALCLAAGLGVGKLEFNEERVRNFAADSPVFRANTLLNERFDGTHYLDVHFHVPPSRSLLEPELIERLADLQNWMRGPGGFVDTGSYLGVLGAVRRAVNPGDTSVWPATQIEAEQLLFLYEASSRPNILGDQLTADRQQAYLRGFLHANNYQDSRPMLAALRAEIDRRFAGTGVEAQITGQVALLASWVGPLLDTMLWGLLSATLMIVLVSALFLRSLREGLLCAVPVAASVLVVFGLMGHLGIWVSVATSMFASITMGLGVDFAIHVLYATRRAEAHGLRGPALTCAVYADIGAPLAVNALTLVLGFSVMAISSVPAVRSFGLLVSAGVIGSFIGACLILPALHALGSRRSLDRSLATATTLEKTS